MTVLIGIDLGDRRIGIAWGDSSSGSVAPVTTLRRTTPEHDAESIERIRSDRHATGIVVGLPLHMDGSESEQSTRTREWADAVAPALAAPLTFRDE